MASDSSFTLFYADAFETVTQQVSLEEWAVLVTAWNCPDCAQLGCYTTHPDKLARWTCRMNRKLFDKTLESLIEKKYVEWDAANFLIFLPKFVRKVIKNANQLKASRRLLHYNLLPNCELKKKYWAALRAVAERFNELEWFGERYQEPFAKPLPKQEEEKENKKKKEEEAPPPYSEIIDFLNEATGKQFKATGDATRRHINARWNEGHRIEAFKQVITNKAGQWKHDPDMAIYLRPETLFGNKFESYLNEEPMDATMEDLPKLCYEVDEAKKDIDHYGKMVDSFPDHKDCGEWAKMVDAAQALIERNQPEIDRLRAVK